MINYIKERVQQRFQPHYYHLNDWIGLNMIWRFTRSPETLGRLTVERLCSPFGITKKSPGAIPRRTHGLATMDTAGSLWVEPRGESDGMVAGHGGFSRIIEHQELQRAY